MSKMGEEFVFQYELKKLQDQIDDIKVSLKILRIAINELDKEIKRESNIRH